MNTAVKAAREARGYSQEQLAALSGVSTRTIGRIETGRSPSIETLARIAQALEVPLHALISTPTPA